MSITAKNPIRTVISGLSDYYTSKGCAIRSVENALNESGYFLDDTGPYDWSGLDGSANVPFYIGYGNIEDVVGYINFSWYRMGSGKWEFTIYVAL